MAYITLKSIVLYSMILNICNSVQINPFKLIVIVLDSIDTFYPFKVAWKLLVLSILSFHCKHDFKCNTISWKIVFWCGNLDAGNLSICQIGQKSTLSLFNADTCLVKPSQMGSIYSAKKFDRSPATVLREIKMVGKIE